MDFSLPRFSEPFPLAGAVYIEYLEKRGHFINEDDLDEAQDRSNKPQAGKFLAAHLEKIDWLDRHYPLQTLTRYSMEVISSGGIAEPRSLFRCYQGSWPMACSTPRDTKGLSFPLMQRIAWSPLTVSVVYSYHHCLQKLLEQLQIAHR